MIAGSPIAGAPIGARIARVAVGGSASDVTILAAGSGLKLSASGASSAVQISALANGVKLAANGADTSVALDSTGSGSKLASGAATSLAEVIAEALGFKRATNGTEAAVDVLAVGAGVGTLTPQAGTGGSQARVDVEALGSGSKSIGSGSSTTVSVDVLASGIKVASQGAATSAEVAAAALGFKRGLNGSQALTHVLVTAAGLVVPGAGTGGSNAVVEALPVGLGTKSSAGGSDAIVELLALGGGQLPPQESGGGGAATVAIDGTGDGFFVYNPDAVCGTGGWVGPLPGDPSNNVVLSATPAFTGINVSWTYPALRPEAVAHVQLYRNTEGNFETASLRRIVNGDYFFDQSTVDDFTEYFYWIRIVSIHGTVGLPIGPASATARPSINDLIIALTGQIDAGLLATTLRTEIERIPTLQNALNQEVLDRTAEVGGVTNLIGTVISDNEDTRDMVLVEESERLAQNSAFVDALNQEIVNRLSGTDSLQTQISQLADATAALVFVQDTPPVPGVAGVLDPIPQGARWFKSDENNKPHVWDSALLSWVSIEDPRVGQNAADVLNLQTDLQDETNTRASAIQVLDSTVADLETGQLAQAQQITLLEGETGDNAAAITAEQTTRSTADSALAQDISTLQTSTGNNTAAISAESLARTNADTALAQDITNLTTSVGNNASAIGQETTSRTNADFALAQDISTLTVATGETAAAITTESTARANADTGLAQQIASLVSVTDDNAAAISAETTARTTADSALASDVSLLQTVTDDNAAAIVSETLARTSADNSLASDVTILFTNTGNNAAAIQSEQIARTNADTALASDITTLISNVNGANAAILTEATTRASEDNALASSITTVETSLGNDIAAVEVDLQATADDVGNIGALYTVQVDVNGQVGGFGVYNDGTDIEAGFDVDRFWVGKTNANRKKPFIISGGVVYIDQAMIQRANIFDLAIENRIQSDNFVAGSSGFRINRNGTFEMNGGTFRGAVVFTAPPGGQNQITYANLGGTKPPTNADRTASNTSANTNGVAGTAATTVRDNAAAGASANTRVNSWVRPGTTLINGNQIFTGDAYVDTLQIKGNAVTVPEGTAGTSNVLLRAYWRSITSITMTFPSNARPTAVLVQGFLNVQNLTDNNIIFPQIRIITNNGTMANAQGEVTVDSGRRNQFSCGGTVTGMGGTYVTITLQARITVYSSPNYAREYSMTAIGAKK